MRKLALFFAALALLAPGCVNYQGQYPSPNQITEVVLKENDFKVVKTHMKGTAFCRYVLGFIPLNDPSIVSQALAQIRDQAAMDGRPVQLVNYTEDRFETNYLLFVDSNVTITCDAIEYTR